jgi:bacterioferritin-associated ferredoxin
MIVCICHNVNSTTIDEAIDNGAQSVDAIRNQTCAGSGCGKCLFKVNRQLQDSQKDFSCASQAIAEAL